MYFVDEIDESLPIAERRRQALTRRASKLIEWIGRDEYSIYIDKVESKIRITWLVTFIIHALEESIPKEDWRAFLRLFQEVRFSVQDIGKEALDEIQRKLIYDEAVINLITILETYRVYILTASL